MPGKLTITFEGRPPTTITGDFLVEVQEADGGFRVRVLDENAGGGTPLPEVLVLEYVPGDE